jgi:NAD+ diphosphatase
MGFKIEYRYCPQCRLPMSIRDGNPFCSACDITIYVTDVVAAACVLVIRDGSVLLAKRAREPYQGTIDLIGGFMQPVETPEQAALREAKEETGLTIKITKLHGIYPDQYGDGEYVLGIVYLGEILGGSMQAQDDVGSLEWFEIDQLDPETLDIGFPSVRETLRDLKQWHHRQAQP